MTESLKKTPYSKLLRFDALDMLYKSAELKFKTYVLMPFLDAICKGNDETGFINFINTCFNEINVVNVDEVVKAMYFLSSGATGLLYPQVENHPKTILLNYVMKCMGVDHEFPYYLYTKDNLPKEGSIKKVSISEDIQISGVLIGRDAVLEGEKRLLIDCKPVEVYSYYNSEQSKGNSVGYYVGTDNQLIQFGSELTIDTYFISTEPEEYKDLMFNIIDNSKTTYDMFKRVKQFYKRLKIELHRNGQM